MVRHVAAAVLVAWAWSPSSVAAQPGLPTALDERHQHVATIVTGEIGKLTGPVTRHCGIFTLAGGPESPPPVERRDVAGALRCVLAAQRAGRASWAIWQVPGVDAIVFDGIAASAVSAVHLVQSEGSDGRVTLRPCLAPKVAKDGTLTCANSGPPDVPKALDGLLRDAKRTTRRPAPEISLEGAGVDAADADAAIARAVEAAQRTVHAAGNEQWPRCPRHFDHALVVRDGWWFCEKEAAFIAELGRLSRVVRRPRR